MLLKVLLEKVSGPCSPRMSAGSSLVTTWHHLHPLLWLLIQENQWRIHCRRQLESAKELIDTFFHLLGEALQSVPTYWVCAHERCVHSSMHWLHDFVFHVTGTADGVSGVKTACHLGLCIAVRLTEAVPLVNSREENGE